MDVKPLMPHEESHQDKETVASKPLDGPIVEVSNAYCAGKETSVAHSKILIQPNMAVAPSPYFHLACLACCCCWPVGYFAMIRAAMCKSAIAHNNMAAANTLSREVRRTALWAIGIGVFMGLVYASIILFNMYYFYKRENALRGYENDP